MDASDYTIVTNNPLVLKTYGDTHTVLYFDLPFQDLLVQVRDRVYEGYRLLTHPLSGSVKPNETPYKSVMMTKERGELNLQSVQMIEDAILGCQKFAVRYDQYKPEVYDDFQLIDLTLLESGMASVSGF